MDKRKLIARIAPIFIILAVTLLSSYKSIPLYFWHDDFTAFYLARTGSVCRFSFPYESLCPIFGTLERVLFYDPVKYHILDVLLFFLTSLAFYGFLNQLLTKKTSLVTTLIFSAGYVSAGVFLEAYDPIISFLPLGLFFLSLTILMLSVRNRLNVTFFSLSLLLFGLSLSAFYARSSTYLFPFLLIIFLYASKISQKKRILMGIVATLIFFIFYFILPLGLMAFRSSNSLLMFIMHGNYLKIATNFFETVSSFVVTDNPQITMIPFKLPIPTNSIRLAIGLITIILPLCLLLKEKAMLRVFKLRALAIFWIVMMYLPYGLRTDTRIMSIDRYLIFTYPGILLLWATLGKDRRWWLVVSAIIILVRVVQSNLLFSENLEVSVKRQAFYTQMHSLINTLPKNAFIFIDAPQQSKNEVADFLRVGAFKSEAALGAEFKTNFDDINLVTDSDSLRELIADKQITEENYLSFYYDGMKLIQTSLLSHKIIKEGHEGIEGSIDKSSSVKLQRNPNSNLWVGENTPLEFTAGGLIPIFPVTIRLNMIASVARLNLPYSQGCSGCRYEAYQDQNILNYLSAVRMIKENIENIVSDDTGKGAFVKYLLDNDSDTLWFSNRQDWYGGKKPSIEFFFKNNVSVEGLILYSTPGDNFPQRLEVYSDDKKISDDMIQAMGQYLKVSIPKLSTSHIRLVLLDTQGGNAPVISEVDFIPSGYMGIDLSQVVEVQKHPAAAVNTDKDLVALSNFMSSGAAACLQWESPDYGSGQSPFILKADGLLRSYDIELPVMGINSPTLRIGCLNYPANVFIKSVQVK